MSSTETPHSSITTWPVIGHDWATMLLQRAVASPGHAYLITGPRHVGKTTLARAFGQALICELPGEVACAACRACQLMARGVHPDFRLVQPLDKNGQVDRVRGILRADQAGDLVREVAMRPMEGRYKIFVVQDVHTAHDSFANKILKTLEEPSDHVILLLTADDRANVLGTIVSRCQVLPLRPLDTKTVRAALQTQWHVDDALADLLARLSTGRLGWAVQERGDTHFLATRAADIDRLEELVRSDRVARLAFAEELSGSRDSQAIFRTLELWLSWWRDVMLWQSGCAEAIRNTDRIGAIERHGRALSRAAVQRFLVLLQQIDAYLRHTVNPRLAMDVLLLNLPQERAAS